MTYICVIKLKTQYMKYNVTFTDAEESLTMIFPGDNMLTLLAELATKGRDVKQITNIELCA